MVLKLHTASVSSCGRRVAVILFEKNVPFELIEPDWAVQEHKSDEWKKNQPFGQMPYIDDDGFILFESRAIGRYIAAKYASSGTPLLPDPSDIKANAILDQGISIETSNFNKAAEGLFAEVSMKKMRGLEPDPVFVKYHEDTLATKMPGFELLLGKQKYMAGDQLTVADFFFLSYGTVITQLGYDYLINEEKYPNLSRWWKEVSSRPSWQKVKDGIPKEGNSA